MSHAGEVIVAAVFRRASIGIDTEAVVPGTARRQLWPKVGADDEPPPNDERQFLRTWVRKEAVVKATDCIVPDTTTSRPLRC